MQYNDNENDAWMALIDKHEVSEEKQDILNEVTNKWNTCRIKDTSQYTGIYFNELYNINLKFNNIKKHYEK